MIRRKPLIKSGRRLTMTGWQRYWIELWGSSLVYYSPKTLTKSTDRKDYKVRLYTHRAICSIDAAGFEIWVGFIKWFFYSTLFDPHSWKALITARHSRDEVELWIWMGVNYFTKSAMKCSSCNSSVPLTLVSIDLFQTDPCKCQSITGWFVMIPPPMIDTNCFQLTDPVRKDVYKFRAPSSDVAQVWIHR